MSIKGSTARAAFAEALAVVRDHRPPARSVLPVQYRPPSAPAPRPAEQAAAHDDRWVGPPPSGWGPLCDALDAQVHGRVASVDLVDQALAAIDQRDGPLAGMVHTDAEGAMAAAAAADQSRGAGDWLGPLHGIPVTVKDVIDVAGMPTRAGSDAYHELPTVDAVAVARLRAAGAVIMGKTSTHEFALGVTQPQSRNPHDHSRLPGGSSGGSAISVATGMALASLGTDTRASIRVPAALSGVVGFKATIGLVPTAGVVTLSWTMDHVAPMASSVTDAAVTLDALVGVGSRLRRVRAADHLRVGLPAAAMHGAEPGVTAAVTAALSLLADRDGCTVVPADRPTADDLAVANAAGLLISRCEAAAGHRAMGLDRTRYWEEVGDQLDEADEVTAVDYLDAQRLRGVLADRLLAAFDTVDVLAMPTSMVVAPPAEDFADYLVLLARNAIPWSLVGFPAISLPCGTSDGLPVGLQLVARPGAEATLVGAALAVEEVLAC